MNQDILTLQHVYFSYHTPQGETAALSDLSFSVAKAEFIAIVGPSGCGKSTLLNILCGMLRPDGGEILFCGHPLHNMSPDIGYMLQKDQLFEWKTIYENVMLGPNIQKYRTPEVVSRVDRMLSAYGLDNFRHVRPSGLSGGMRQRAALIRTLALDPEILLLDEPFSALDYQTRLEVSGDIHLIIKKERKTAILVTHDLSEAIAMADRILVFSHRPATIKKNILLTFPDGISSASERRNCPEFLAYFNQIWKELKSDEHTIQTV